MDNELTRIKNLVRVEIANYLGVDTEDIEDETVLTDDLHMTPTDLTDLVEILTSKGLDTAKLDMSTVETFGELVETLTEQS